MSRRTSRTQRSPRESVPHASDSGVAGRRTVRGSVAGLLAVGVIALGAVLVASNTDPSRAGAGTRPASPPRLALVQAVPVGASTLWVIAQNETRLSGGAQSVEVTRNAGATWSTVTPPDLRVDGGAHYLFSVVALSATRAWLAYGGAAETSRSFLASTSDAGRHWSPVGALPPSGCVTQFVSPRDGTCTQLGGAAGSMVVVLYRTTNGGVTWRRIFANSPSSTTASRGSLPFGCDKTLTFETASTGWALFFCNAGSGAIIDGTTNGGVTWSPRAVTPPRSVPEGGGGFTGPGVFRGARGALPYVVGTDAALYVTRDGGRSFTPVYPPGPPRPWTVDVISPTQWRLTLGRQILGTNDAGVSWFRRTSDTVLQPTTYRRGAPPGGVVTFTTTRNAWLVENLGGSNAALLHSSDGGRSWRRVAVPGVS